MVSIEGLTSKKWKTFTDLLIQANNIQIKTMLDLTFTELTKRNAHK